MLREAREELPGAPEWFFEHLADTVHDRPLGDSSVAFPERSKPEHVVFWGIDVTSRADPVEVLKWLSDGMQYRGALRHEWAPGTACMSRRHYCDASYTT